MTDEPRPGGSRGAPSGEHANPWVHQDHPRVADASATQATPTEPSYPSAGSETYALYRPRAGDAAPDGWPAPGRYPPAPDAYPAEADPYGIRGQTVFDDLYRAPSGGEPSASAMQGMEAPGAPLRPVPPWGVATPPGAYRPWPVPASAVVLPADADPWRAFPMTAEERRWAPAAHWLPLLTTWLGPLIVLLTVGERDARVRESAKESLNFELTFTLAMLASVLLVFVGVGLVLVVALPLVWFFLRVVAAARVGRGEMYRYPLRIPFLS